MQPGDKIEIDGVKYIAAEEQSKFSCRGCVFDRINCKAPCVSGPVILKKDYSDLISMTKEALQLHIEWKEHQQKLTDEGKEVIQNVGGVEWHQRWIYHYEELLKVLEKL